MFSDASHANLPDLFSSDFGFDILVVGQNRKSCPLAWNSDKTRRVVKRTLAAAALALGDALDCAFCLKSFIEELTQSIIEITVFVGNQSLHDNLISTKSVSEKRLRIDLAAIKTMLENS